MDARLVIIFSIPVHCTNRSSNLQTMDASHPCFSISGSPSSLTTILCNTTSDELPCPMPV